MAETTADGPPVLSKPLLEPEERRALWSSLVAGADLAATLVSPVEARDAPGVAVAARASILLRTYAGDYHTDAFALERLARRVAAGDERLFFWGAPEPVARLRRLLATASPEVTANSGGPTGALARALDELDLGTASLIDVSDVFGPGVWELTRTGSVSRSVSALAPNLAVLGDLLGDDLLGDDLLGDDLLTDDDPVRTVVSTPRNRTTTPSIRGGHAIHRLHVRSIGSAFLGLAPWYRMQGGFLEILDYRQLYRDPETVVRRLADAPAPVLVDAATRHLARDLISLAFGLEVRPREAPSVDADGRAPGWRTVEGEDGERAAAQPRFLVPAADGGAPLEPALDAALARPAACVAVRLPLTGFDSRPAQELLAERGFRFAALEPPGVASRGPGAEDWIGTWGRPDPALPPAPPYYLDTAVAAAPDRAVLRHLRPLVEEWTRRHHQIGPNTPNTNTANAPNAPNAPNIPNAPGDGHDAR